MLLLTPFALWTFLLSLLKMVCSNYSVDLCSWKGSGLSQEPGSVEQIFLHCAEGDVEWLYPVGALHLSLSPRIPSQLTGPATPGSSGAQVTACIKPAESFRGAQIYLERDGELQLLVWDRQEEEEEDGGIEPKVHCFSRSAGEKVALFIQSTLHRDISRRIAAFKYELRGDWSSGVLLSQQIERACRPCNDTEVLMAVCTSDFVVRGHIRSVFHDAERQESIVSVSTTKIYRQKYTLFHPIGKYGKSFGEVRTFLKCGVKQGVGSFIFTGHVHFGEAWLGCAPRYKDFKRISEVAKEAHENQCEIESD
ncbi:meteorin isoform X1 [Rhincodon typus]|uniref:meteorin isoform X1 n=1 Tax=Rhincodon typus TaxID=259920 RepID=UPI002030628C|nr:meteorin isoform X1 [Rhincodon typus]